jgi:hypothetical protein
MFRLGRPDVLPELDLGVQKGLQLAYGLDTLPKPREVARIAERWAPYRTIAAWYLWRLLDNGDGQAGTLGPPPAKAAVAAKAPKTKHATAKRGAAKRGAAKRGATKGGSAKKSAVTRGATTRSARKRAATKRSATKRPTTKGTRT